MHFSFCFREVFLPFSMAIIHYESSLSILFPTGLIQSQIRIAHFLACLHHCSWYILLGFLYYSACSHVPCSVRIPLVGAVSGRWAHSVYRLSRLINRLHFIPHEDFVMILRWSRSFLVVLDFTTPFGFGKYYVWGCQETSIGCVEIIQDSGKECMTYKKWEFNK